MQPPASTDGGTEGDIAHVNVLLTDAPARFESVFVTISMVEISGSADGWITLADQPQRFDLLTLQNDATALLGGARLEPGSYNQLRLMVDSASVVVGGIEEPLEIASGAQTGIKLNVNATVAAGMTYTLVIDYDAAKSIKSTGQGYLMTPVIKVKSLTGAPTGPSDVPEGPSAPSDASVAPDAPGAEGDAAANP